MWAVVRGSTDPKYLLDSGGDIKLVDEPGEAVELGGRPQVYVPEVTDLDSILHLQTEFPSIGSVSQENNEKLRIAFKTKLDKIPLKTIERIEFLLSGDHHINRCADFKLSFEDGNLEVRKWGGYTPQIILWYTVFVQVGTRDKVSLHDYFGFAIDQRFRYQMEWLKKESAYLDQFEACKKRTGWTPPTIKQLLNTNKKDKK